MCGIAGWFTPAAMDSGQQQEAATPRLNSMLDAIAHRGPDGRGQWLCQHAALGHVRLAIIDISGGAQPMSCVSGDIHITFNGEIYNFRALRDELLAAGMQFRTHSDTEVILNLYRQHGTSGFSRLRGMYAFALWDARRREGLLVRDPLGIKPLFYKQATDGELVFGSEAKAILAGGHRGELDESSLHLLMNFRYLPGERSLFKSIRQLQPGEILHWKEGSVRRSYIAAPQYPSRQPMAALEESVAAHMTADVEVGAYLSGGVDSATIVSMASQHSENTLRTFTLAVGDDPDEASNAATTASLLGVNNEQFALQENISEQLQGLIYHLEVPKINALQIDQLARQVSSRVKVVLSGLGGDELFYGYNCHSIINRAHSLSRLFPRPLSSLIGRTGAKLVRSTSGLMWSEPERAAIMLDKLGDWPGVYGVLRNLWDNPLMRTQIYGPRLLDSELPDAFTVLHELWPEEQDPVVATARFEWQSKMVNDLLWNEDRVSMAHGLEVRVPMVDTQVAHSLAQLQRQQLMPHGRKKGYLLEQLGSILPAEILQRPKSGFQVNAGEFFHRHLKPLAGVWLDEEYVRSVGLFNPDYIRMVMNLSPAKAHRWHYFMLYLMLGTHIWYERFVSNNEQQ